jgi:hypothetical protein
MRRINAGVEIFTEPLSLIFSLPVIDDDSNTTLHTHAGQFCEIADDTQQQTNVENRPIYQQRTMHLNSSEHDFLVLQLGRRIPQKHLASLLDQAATRDVED